MNEFTRGYNLVLLFFITILFPISFSLWFVGIEDNVYFWDYRGYWGQFISLSNMIPKYTSDLYLTIRNSIYSSDYNVFIISFFSFISPITGTSRSAFVTLIVLFYLIPFSILFAWLFKRSSETLFSVTPAFLPLVALCIFNTPIWTTVLRGMPDIAGLIPLTFLLFFILRMRENNVDIKTAIGIGLSAWLTFLCRRYYAFSIIPILIFAPFLNLYIFLYVDKKTFKSSAVILFLNYLLAAIACIAPLYFFQYGLLTKILNTSYSSSYDAYQINFTAHIWRLISHFGVIFLLLSFAGLLSGYLIKATRPYVIYMSCCILLTYILFIQTQGFENHHFLMIDFWLLVFQGILLTVFLHSKSNKYNIATISALAVAFMLTWGVKAVTSRENTIFLPSAVSPLLKYNIDEYNRLVNVLLSLHSNSIAVLASGNALNGSMLESLSKERLNKSLVAVPHVDKRDFLIEAPFQAQYIVLTTPLVTHLPRGQEVLRTYSQMFQKMESDGKYSRIADPFNLDEGIQAYILKRNHGPSYEDIKQLLNDIFEIYPEWRKEYDTQDTINRFLHYR